jgi:hypothetical protein
MHNRMPINFSPVGGGNANRLLSEGKRDFGPKLVCLWMERIRALTKHSRISGALAFVPGSAGPLLRTANEVRCSRVSRSMIASALDSSGRGGVRWRVLIAYVILVVGALLRGL